MQTITTKYRGPATSRGSRIIASASGGAGRITFPVRNEHNIDWNHREAAKALASKLDWSGEWQGGDGKQGAMVWVWKNDDQNTFTV